MKIAALHQVFLRVSQACTDSRNIPENSMFFALRGAHFNGNAFASEALGKGAAYAVIDEEQYADGENLILVSNVLETLQELANFHRKYCRARVIALTGSNGKTTTKELMYAVLSKKYRTVATKGNLNNHIGVPLTLLSIKKNTEMVIVEMGANHKREIAFLCGIAEPDYGYITNFGKAHLEGFGGEQGVIEGKSELYEHLISKGLPVFINADDPVQRERVGAYPKKIGFSAAGVEGYLPVRFLEAHPFVSLEFAGITMKTKLVGDYNFNNCAAAVLVGHTFEVPATEIRDALEAYLPANNRSQLLEIDGRRILLDAYNANPSSMKAALENFKSMAGSPKSVYLGDMFELGEAASEEHQQIADLALRHNYDHTYLIGENFSKVTTPLPTFKTYEAFESYIKQHKPEPGTILIKGSRGMALERILEVL